MQVPLCSFGWCGYPGSLHAPTHPLPFLPSRLHRYDSLLKAAWARQCALSGNVAPMPPLHAVGATLNVDRLVHVAQTSSRWRNSGSVPQGACVALGGVVWALLRWQGACAAWGAGALLGLPPVCLQACVMHC